MMIESPLRSHAIPRMRGPPENSISFRVGLGASGSTIQIDGVSVPWLTTASRLPSGAHASTPFPNPRPKWPPTAATWPHRDVPQNQRMPGAAVCVRSSSLQCRRSNPVSVKRRCPPPPRLRGLQSAASSHWRPRPPTDPAARRPAGAAKVISVRRATTKDRWCFPH